MTRDTPTNNDQLRSRRTELLADEATGWLERLTTGKHPTAPEETLAWLKEQPANVNALLMEDCRDELIDEHIHACTVDVDAVLNKVVAANVTQVGDQAMHRNSQRHQSSKSHLTRRMTLSIAASVVVCLSIAFIAWRMSPDTVFETPLGEQRSIPLSDGSVVVLNTQSRVRTQITAESRDIYLESGQANFTVAQDPSRPFRVHTRTAVIQVLGTKFDVHVLTDRTNVAVIEGRVQVASGAQSGSAPAQLSAGEAIMALEQGSLTPVAPANIAQITAWQQRRLVFQDNTLAEILAEFSRYNRSLNIRIDGDELQSRRFSGVFEADDPLFLVNYLESDPRIMVDRIGEQVVIRPR